MIKTYDPVLGLEVHVELGTRTKMFCGAEVEYGGAPNTQVTPVSLGLPGALPVVNAKAVESAIKVGLALNCKIAESTRFARKHYFYPDVPKNFQTSQADHPIAYDGYLDVELSDGEIFRVDIERVHMEEDAGKNTHIGGHGGRIHGAEHSLIDYNRAGIPLIEIVTRPITGTGDRAAEVASAYVATLRDIMRTLEVSEAKMERGHVRADVNLSLRATPQSPLGTRTETKNVNSFRAIEKAVRSEIVRQSAILTAGGSIKQETRHWHEETGSTTAGRAKSDADDYRYFPEPDLVPVEPSKEWIEELRASIPEMPVQKRKRLQQAWGYSDAEMRDVINSKALKMIEDTISYGLTPLAARKWWMGELAKIAKVTNVSLAELDVTPAQIQELQQMIDAKTITDKTARKILPRMINGGGSAKDIVEAEGLGVVSDDTALLSVIDQVLTDQPELTQKIRSGNLGPISAVIGAVMKATRGQADASRVKELVIERTK